MAEETATPEPETPTETPEASSEPTTPSDPPAAEPGAAEAAPTENQSLADGGGGDDVEQPVPATWPEDWRQRWAGSDEKALQYLNRYKSPDNVFKALQALRAKMDSGEFARSKPDATDEKAYGEWKTENGIPEAPEGYLESLPEDLRDIPEEDKANVDRYLKIAHANDATPDEVARGLEAYYQIQEQQAEERLEADKRYRAQSEDNLRAEWGPEYRPNLNAMHGLFDQHAPEGLRERLFTARFADGTMLGDDEQTLQFLVGLAREVNPFGTITPSPGQNQQASIDARISELETEMADTKARGGPDSYWHNPAKQEEYRRLLTIRDKAKGRAA